MTATQPRLNPGPGRLYAYTVTREAYWADEYHNIDPHPALLVHKTLNPPPPDPDASDTVWQFTILERRFTLPVDPAVEVRIHDDAFQAFAEIAPFFAALADRRPATLDEVRAILDQFGFADVTERTEPD